MQLAIQQQTYIKARAVFSLLSKTDAISVCTASIEPVVIKKICQDEDHICVVKCGGRHCIPAETIVSTLCDLVCVTPTWHPGRPRAKL